MLSSVARLYRNFWVKEDLIMAKLKITLTRSLIGRPETQRKTIKALGLKKLNSSVELPDNESVRGQLHKVEHLITVEEQA